MEKIKVEKKNFKLLSEAYDWNQATDVNDRKLFSNTSKFNEATVFIIFNEFTVVEVSEKDEIFGVFSSGQKVQIAKAPHIFESVQDLKKFERYS